VLQTLKGDVAVEKLFPAAKIRSTCIAVGHSRLITNGMDDNQPVVLGGVVVLHNGIVVNHEELWSSLESRRQLSIDTEVIAAIADAYLQQHRTLDGVGAEILKQCLGSVSCAIVAPDTGEIALFSNTGSLYVGTKDEVVFFPYRCT
jgi:glucosamine 6-phosphate synthetase-like amidotransferase/phosphosugar isomerase protein